MTDTLEKLKKARDVMESIQLGSGDEFEAMIVEVTGRIEHVIAASFEEEALRIYGRGGKQQVLTLIRDGLLRQDEGGRNG